jgi:hypothetical protein
VRPAQYAAFGEALFWSLERQFGAAFTPELREAWRALYATVQAEMLRAGMRESVPAADFMSCSLGWNGYPLIWGSSW